MIFYGLIFVLILAIDIVVKLWAQNFLSAAISIPVIKDVFHLTYTQNTGAAFSILEGQRWFFIVLTFIMLVLIGFAFFKSIFKGKWGKTTLVFIFGGAVGNFIDRLFYGYVVDMFDFCLINFPVFNVADIFLTVGAVMGIIYVLFIDKDFLSDNKKKDTDEETDKDGTENSNS